MDIKDFKKMIEIYKKENCAIKTLSNIVVDPLTREIKYREHFSIKSIPNVSLTSHPKVQYYEIVNGVRIKKWVQTNLLGSQINGKNQYGLNYVLKEDSWKDFSETEKLNIRTLRNFGIVDKKSLIGYKFKMWVNIKAQQQWNVLFRGESSYQMRSQVNREDSFINLQIKLNKMSNLETYDYIKQNTTMNEMFWIEQKYYSQFKNINYYNKKEWEELRKKEMQNYKENKIDNKDDLL